LPLERFYREAIPLYTVSIGVNGFQKMLNRSFPALAMPVFMSFHTMIDRLFVSNLIGTSALPADNLTAPVIQEDFTFLILMNVIVA